MNLHHLRSPHQNDHAVDIYLDTPPHPFAILARHHLFYRQND